jgi:hypothetical protein
MLWRCRLVVFIFVSLGAAVAQDHSPISVIDFVKIKYNKTPEAIFFYENNWKVYRNIAISEGFIKSYRMIRLKEELASEFDLICITEFSDASQLKLSEARFQQIIKDIRPQGPRLLNTIQPADFRQVVFSKTATILFDGARSRRSHHRFGR